VTDASPIAMLPAGYHRILAGARQRFEGDDRVRGMWLGGSLGRGTADAASDLDVLLAVADDAHDGFLAGWRTWLADVTPTVLAEALPFAPGMYYSVTPDFERFDVVVEPVSALPTTFFRSRVTLFDRDGLTARIPPPEPGPGPSADAVRGLISEYFRISAVETILVRDDWLLAREHVHAVASLVYRLFVESNAPLPPMGVKQWSAKLTPDQRSVLASLPTDAADVSGLRTAHLAMAAVFVPTAEALALRLGVPWPHDLEAAAAAHLSEVLGLDDPYRRTGRAVADTPGR
jgi:hypothetical protein